MREIQITLLRLILFLAGGDALPPRRCFNWAGEDVRLTFEGKRLTNYLADLVRGVVSPNGGRTNHNPKFGFRIGRMSHPLWSRNTGDSLTSILLRASPRCPVRPFLLRLDRAALSLVHLVAVG
jgi:hypothetical protein